ncbi:MAG: hypothetical protein WHU54_04670 [Candidatus Bathyarchaeia archaeon]|jgi:type II secretory pathway pseudopilin PulG
MRPRSLRHHNSGQVLIIISLIVTLLILSTAVYVIKTEENRAASNIEDANPALSAYQLGLMHTVTSALVNVSNGGTEAVLPADLNQFASVVEKHLYDVLFSVEFTPIDTAPYQNGFWLNWAANGQGVSSACVDFRINASGLSASYQTEYSVNVTSEIQISGAWIRQGNLKSAIVTCTVRNDGTPALAQNFTVYFERDGSLTTEEWIMVESPSITSYGNGTYSIMFTAETTSPDDPLIVSVHCRDLRGIFIRANVTCTRI